MADLVLGDFQIFAPQVVNDQDNNGGNIDLTSRLYSGNLEVTFGDVPSDERESGSDKFRKVFLAVQSLNNGSAFSNKVWLHRPTPGDDYALFYGASIDDTKGTLDTSAPFGVGTLVSAVDATATTIIVEVEHTDAVGIFRDTEKFIISNKELAASITGDSVVRTINATPSVNGLQITITFDDQLGYSFAAGSTVSSIYEPGIIKASNDTIVVTSSAGTIDDVGSPIAYVSKGAVKETITLTFSSSSDFTYACSFCGGTGSGNISTGVTITNPVNSSEICTIASSFFGGTFANGDTVAIPVIPAHFAVFERRKIPAGANSLSSDLIHLAWSCESS